MEKRVAHNKSSKEKESLVIKTYLENKSARKTSLLLNIPKSTVLIILKRNSIDTSISYLTPELDTNIVELYNKGFSSIKISRSLHISKGKVLKVLTNKNIVKRSSNDIIYKKYFCDESYFEKIDSEDKAYFLGLLVSDGCVTPHGNMVLSLQECDKKILETFSTYIKYSGNLKYFVKLNPKWSNIYSLNISSRKLVSDLSKHFIIPNKTHFTRFPDISKNYYSHFIRGLFDGDGCISLSNNKYYFNICGNYDLISKVQEILVEECKLNYTKLRIPNKDSSNICVMAYSGNRQLLKIKEFLYKDKKDLFIERKFDKFNSIKKKWKS